MVIALGSALGAWADTETVDGIVWNYTVSDGKAQVGIGGNSGTRAVLTSTTGEITIPSTLGGNPVTSVGAYAFSGCGKLTSVTIPNSVTSIGSYAFYGCSGLKEVSLPSRWALSSIFPQAY
ncbi:MAG: leucine-rich repeat domain-containing protein, partial [Kiritimatiellae bacterium]|nr:leucine-rich repeat domain-containing protein [Kiritimatiellia bacterium]